MKQLLDDDPYFHSGYYDYDDIGDDEITLWHDSGRAARVTRLEADDAVCSVSLFYGSDPWAGSVADGLVRSETDLKTIVKGWCEHNLAPSMHNDGRSLMPPKQPDNG